MQSRRTLSHPSLLVGLSLALAACSNDIIGDGTGGGGGGGGGGGATTTAASSGVGPVSASSSSGGDPTASAGGGPASSSSSGISGAGGSGPGVGGSGGAGGGPSECDADPVDLFPEVALDVCANDRCCTEARACAEDVDACFDEEGELDREDERGAALAACMEDAFCGEEADGICRSGISYDDPQANACLGERCCDAFTFCADEGGPFGCIDCFDEGGGIICNQALLCAANECGIGEAPYDCAEVPDVEVFPEDPEVDACGNENCCAEMTLCAESPGSCFTTFQGERVLDLGEPGGRAMQACMIASCPHPGMICDSSLVDEDVELAACLSKNCCAEFNDCTDDGDNGALCVDCFQDGEPYGPRCAAAVACELEQCGDI
jgi:hypothetical protein